MLSCPEPDYMQKKKGGGPDSMYNYIRTKWKAPNLCGFLSLFPVQLHIKCPNLLEEKLNLNMAGMELIFLRNTPSLLRRYGKTAM